MNNNHYEKLFLISGKINVVTRIMHTVRLKRQIAICGSGHEITKYWAKLHYFVPNYYGIHKTF